MAPNTIWHEFLLAGFGQVQCDLSSGVSDLGRTGNGRY
jgi:hypothetical protein